MNRQEITATVIATSQLYNEIALSISQQLLTELQNNRIDFDHFMRVNESLVRPLIVESTRMVVDSSIEVMEELDEPFEAILNGSNRLKKAIDRITRVEKIIEVTAGVLTTAALIVTFVGAPNPTSAVAAVSSLGKLINSLKPEKDEEENRAA